MDKNNFKKMLAIHGSNISRWDSLAPKDLNDFFQGDESLQSMYREEEGLDALLSDCAPAPLDQTAKQKIKDATLMKIQRETPKAPSGFFRFPTLPARRRSFVFGAAGLATCAAAIALFWAGPGFIDTPSLPQTLTTAHNITSDTELERLDQELAEIMTRSAWEADEVSMVLSLFEPAPEGGPGQEQESSTQVGSTDADTGTNTETEREIENFLDELLQEDEVPPDIWEMFIQEG